MNKFNLTPTSNIKSHTNKEFIPNNMSNSLNKNAQNNLIANSQNNPNYKNLSEEKMKMLHTLASWILDLRDPNKTEEALTNLAKKRHTEDIAILLWHSVFTTQILVHEIMTVYEFMQPPTMTGVQSNRACNALALLQCIASHNSTRSEFVESRIPVFLYPFLKVHEFYSVDGEDMNENTNSPYDFLRLTSLGVIGALVKSDDESVTKFLLDTEYMPMGLSIIEHGNELTKIVATFILLKILSVKEGLEYCCHTYERFSHVAFILSKVVDQLAKDIKSSNKEESGRSSKNDPKQQTKLLNKIIRCYIRLCDNVRAKKALKECLPENLLNDYFSVILKDTTEGELLKKLRNIVKQEDI